MWRQLIEFITFGKTERMLLYVMRNAHSVTIRHVNSEGKEYIRVTVVPHSLPSIHITVLRRDGIYKTLKTIAKYSLIKISI